MKVILVGVDSLLFVCLFVLYLYLCFSCGGSVLLVFDVVGFE